MKRVFFILLLASFSVQAQNKENKGFFISPNSGVVLLSGQKARSVSSLTEIEYDGKMRWIGGVNIGYQFNPIVAVDFGISYFNSALELGSPTNINSQVCRVSACLVGERNNFLASIGGTLFFNNSSIIKPHLTLRGGVSRSHIIFREFLNLTQGTSNRAGAELVKIDSKGYVPFAQIGLGVDLAYGLGIGYKFMWLGSQRGRTIGGWQYDELEVLRSFSHIAELKLTIFPK